MLSVYDLYDLSRVLINIRAFPEYSLNKDIIKQALYVLSDRFDNHELNQFRTALMTVKGLDETYSFVQVQNVYTYFPTVLKDENVYGLLISTLQSLSKAIEEENREKIVDLADCLHNLPIIIAENHFSIPRNFWRVCVKPYRDKWDKTFLVAEQKLFDRFW